MECGLADTFSTRKPTNRNIKIEREGIEYLLVYFFLPSLFPGFILRK
jgi:hypothetical protein